jgi:transcriptional regulator with XRE-family HTH domain
MIEYERNGQQNRIKNSLFPERFDRIMTVRDVQNQELARAIYVAPSTVSGWRIGRRQPDLHELSLVSSALKVSSDYLLGISNDDSVIVPNTPISLNKDIF